MNAPVRTARRHYAFAVKKVQGGYEVDHVAEYPSRGEADKASLTLLGRRGSGEAITLDRELRSGDLLDRALLKL
jgi:hypothetical protein